MDQRPLPQPDDATAPYWAACREHELRMQRCARCGHLQFPPRPLCSRCQSRNAVWVPVSGRGKVYSWVVCHPPVLPAFRERAPFAVVLVELAEDPGLRIVGNLLDCAADQIDFGLEVEVVFEDRGDEVTVPQWRPAGSSPRA